MNVKCIVSSVLVVSILLTCFTIQPAYSYSGEYTDALSDETPVSSIYSQLDLYDKVSDDHISNPMFESTKIICSDGVISMTPLVSGGCYLKVTGEQSLSLTFFVDYHAIVDTLGDDAVPMKVGLSTTYVGYESVSYVPVPNDGGYVQIPVDGSTDPVSSFYESDDLPRKFYVYIVSVTEVSQTVKITSAQSMALSFKANATNRNAVIVSTDNTISVGASPIWPDPESEQGHVSDPVADDSGHDAVDITYSDNQDVTNAVAVGDENTPTEYNLIISPGNPFCIKYEVTIQKVLWVEWAKVVLKFTVVFTDSTGVHTYTAEISETSSGYLYMPLPGSNALRSSASAPVSESDWIGNGAVSDIEVTVWGYEDRVILHNTAKARVVFYDSIGQ